LLLYKCKFSFKIKFDEKAWEFLVLDGLADLLVWAAERLYVELK
jgi:uncharacterized membrane protein